MDFNKLLKNVNNVDEYISVTQEIGDKCKNTKLKIDITTALALKKIRCLEIEYFHKCYENGAACIILERLLSLPPSKNWGMLGKELVGLLQYWLEAIRKHLLDNTVNWWSFLKLIMKFIKEIRSKDAAMPNILVELTAECLFDIACREKPDAYQRHEILHCLNMYCAESSREIRFALRNKFGKYFTALARLVAMCSYFPCQFVALEALVRWLVPRHEPSLRAAAAARWFPEPLCPAAAKDIFLTSTWINFVQDARNFLNALNEGNGLVTSVVCRRLAVGKMLVISGAEKLQCWLDINSSSKSISVLLDPRLLETMKLRDRSGCEALVIAENNTQTARLFSQSEGLTLSLSTFRPACVQPSDVAAGDASDVTLVLSSRVHLHKLDTALRAVFEDKYHLLIDLDTEMSLSPPRSRDIRKIHNLSEEDTRFSNPELKRKKHPGHTMVKPKKGEVVASPSTASTSSLAQLHDKLAAMPPYTYEKEPVSVCALPQLSNVTEISEAEGSSYNTKLKLTPYGKCLKHKPSTGPLPKSTNKKSAREIMKLKPTDNLQWKKHLSPIEHDENSATCLLVATVGSADNSVISETIERLSKTNELKSDNIIELLVQEAMQELQAKPVVIKEKVIDTSISSGCKKNQDNEENCEATENTPIQNEVKETSKMSKVVKKKMLTIVNKSTTEDESNTEVINETPVFKKSRLYNKQRVPKATECKVADKQSLDVKTVDDFFSQHFGETKAAEIVISPTLARQINETSSEPSESDFDEQYLIINKDLNTNVEHFEIEINKCLKDMMDKVCSNFENHEYLFKDVAPRNDEAGLEDNHTNLQKEIQGPNVSTKLSKPRRSIKLTYKAKKDIKTREVVKKRRKNKTELDPTKKMSTIIEQKDDEIVADHPPEAIDDIEIGEKENKHSPITKNNIETTLKKRKRKLYSPKDEREKKRKGTKVKDIEDVEIVVGEENQSPTPSSNVDTTLMKRKRKLYSPKDEREIGKERKGTKEPDKYDDDIVLSELKTLNRTKTPKTTATCYKEIEQERQKHSRKPRSKRSRVNVEESASPKTLKMNALFDKLKGTVESNEKNILKDKKTIQTDIFNFTSESDDEDFKKKKFDIQKPTSTNTTTTLGSFESSKVLRQRPRPKYCRKSSDDETEKTKVVRKKKAIKKSKSKSQAYVNIEPFIDMADERMRDVSSEVLNTSIVVNRSKEKNTQEVEFKLHEPREMELITEDQHATATKKKKTSKKNKKTETLLVKKEKDLKKDDLKLLSDKEGDRTVSPLPCLVVESMPTCRDDTIGSEKAAMLQKFKKIYQEGPDAINKSSNTQNMLLSDIERCNYSPQNGSINITDELCFVDDTIASRIEKDRSEKIKKNNHNDQQSKLSKNITEIKTERRKLSEDLCCEVVELSSVIPDNKSETSIASDGITAHGDSNEAPPSPGMIRKRMHPREIVDFNESMRDYFVKLNREIQKSISRERRDSSESAEGAEVGVKSPVVTVQRLSFVEIHKESRESSKSAEDAEISKIMRQADDKCSSVKSPVVSVERLSFAEISKWMPSTRSNVTESSTKSSPNRLEHPAFVKVLEESTSNYKAVEGVQKCTSKIKESRQLKQGIVDSSRVKSPILGMSLGEFNKWLPMPDFEEKADTTESSLQTETIQTNIKLLYNTRQRSKTIKANNDSDIELNTKRPQIKSTFAVKGEITPNATGNTSEDSDFNSDRIKAHLKTKSFLTSTVKKTKESDSKKTEAKNKSFARNNTVISPVESLEDFFTNTCKDLEYGDEPCSTKIGEMERANSKSTVKHITRNCTQDHEQRSESASTITKPVQSIDSSRKVTRPQDSTRTKVKEIESLDSSSTKVDDEIFKRPMKRMTSPILRQSKKIEANMDTVTIDSRTSTSSVNDWLKRTEPSSRPANIANDTSLLLKDTLQVVLEKLDTTLEQTNQTTSKKFVSLFVVAQEQLKTLQEERSKMYRTTKTEIITEFADIMEEKFADLDKRSKELDETFQENLKSEAVKFISEDCKKKRALVRFLKEDVQAVIDHIARRGAETRHH